MNRLKDNLKRLQDILDEDITPDNKWAIYSLALNIIKFILEDLIDNTLTPEEKKSESYKQLLESLNLLLSHLNIDNKETFFNKKNVTIAGGAAGGTLLITEIIKFIMEFLKGLG